MPAITASTATHPVVNGTRQEEEEEEKRGWVDGCLGLTLTSAGSDEVLWLRRVWPVSDFVSGKKVVCGPG